MWRLHRAEACSHARPAPQVNGVALHEAEHHQAVEALRGAGATVQMRLWRERMVEPENAVTVTPLRPEDDYSPRERRCGGLRPPQPEAPGPLRQRHVACLVRSEKGLGFSIAGGKGSTPYRAGDGVSKAAGGGGRGGRDQPHGSPHPTPHRASSSPASPRGALLTGPARCRSATVSSRYAGHRGPPRTPPVPAGPAARPLTSLAPADQRGGHGGGPARPRRLSADHRLPHHRPAAGARGRGAPSSQPPATLTPRRSPLPPGTPDPRGWPPACLPPP